MAMVLKVASEFSPVPIGRYKGDSDKSGEVFREDFLFPRISEAMKQGDVLIVDLEGMEGLSSSFLEEAFGGLVRENKLSPEDVLRTLKFKPENSYFDPYIENTKKYIREANQ